MGNKSSSSSHASVSFRNYKQILVVPTDVDNPASLIKHYPYLMAQLEPMRTPRLKLYIALGTTKVLQISSITAKCSIVSSPDLQTNRKGGGASELLSASIVETKNVLSNSCIFLDIEIPGTVPLPNAVFLRIEIEYTSSKSSQSRRPEIDTLESIDPIAVDNGYASPFAFAVVDTSIDTIDKVYAIFGSVFRENLLPSTKPNPELGELAGLTCQSMLYFACSHYYLVAAMADDLSTVALRNLWSCTVASVSEMVGRILAADICHNWDGSGDFKFDDSYIPRTEGHFSLRMCLLMLVVLGQSRRFLNETVDFKVMTFFSSPQSARSKRSIRKPSSASALGIKKVGSADEARAITIALLDEIPVSTTICRFLFSIFLFEDRLLAEVALLHETIANLLNPQSKVELSSAVKSPFASYAAHDLFVNNPIENVLSWIWNDLAHRISRNLNCLVNDPYFDVNIIESLIAHRRRDVTRGKLLLSEVTEEDNQSGLRSGECSIDTTPIPHFRIIRLLPLLHHFCIIPTTPPNLFADYVRQFSSVREATSYIRERKNSEAQFTREVRQLVNYVRKHWEQNRGENYTRHLTSIRNSPFVAHSEMQHLYVPTEIIIPLLKATPKLRQLSTLSELTIPSPSTLITMVDVLVEVIETYRWSTPIAIAEDLKCIEMIQNWLFRSIDYALSAPTYPQSIDNMNELKHAHLFEKEMQLVTAVLLKFSPKASDIKCIGRMLQLLAEHMLVIARIDIRVVGWSDEALSQSLLQVAQNCFDFAMIANCTFDVTAISNAGEEIISVAKPQVDISVSGGLEGFSNLLPQGTSSIGKCFFQLVRYWSDILSTLVHCPDVYNTQCGYIVLAQPGNVGSKEMYCRLASTVMLCFENEGSFHLNHPEVLKLDIIGISAQPVNPYKVDSIKFPRIAEEFLDTADGEELLEGFEIIVKDNDKKYWIFQPSADARKGWINALSRALDAVNTNIVHADDLIDHVSPLSREIVVEEWFEIQTAALTRWKAIKPFRFFNRYNEPLCLPSVSPPFGWNWISLSGIKDYSSDCLDMVSFFGSHAMLFVKDPQVTDNAGWEYAENLEVFDARYSQLLSLSSGKKKFRRRKWVRVRARSRNPSMFPEIQPLNSSYLFYLETQKLAVPLFKNLAEHPSLREVVLSIAKMGVNAAIQTRRQRSSSINLAEDILDAFLCCCGCDDMDFSVQSLLLDALEEILSNLQNYRWKYRCISSLCRKSRIGHETSMSYLNQFLSVFWLLIHDVFETLADRMLTVRPLTLEFLSFSASLSSSQDSTIMDKFRSRNMFVSPLIADVDELLVWSTVLLWNFNHSLIPPKSWTPPTVTIATNYLNRMKQQASYLLSQLRQARLDISLDSAHEDYFAVWIHTLRYFFQQYRSRPEVSESIVPDVPTNHLASALDWWNKIDMICHSIANEFSFEYFSLVYGLRSPFYILTLEQNQGPCSFVQLKIIWSGLRLEKSIDDIVRQEIVWISATKAELEKLHRICFIFFSQNLYLAEVIRSISQRYEHLPVRWIRQVLHQKNPIHLDDDADSDPFPTFESPIPHEFIDSVPFLAIFDDWRYGNNVSIHGADGPYADKINGIYQFSFQSAAVPSEVKLETLESKQKDPFEYCFVGERNGGSVELRLNASRSNWEILWFAHTYSTDRRIRSASVLVASSAVSDLDSKGNNCDNWLVNMSSMLKIQSLLPVAMMRCVGMGTLPEAMAQYCNFVEGIQDSASAHCVDVQTIFHGIWVRAYSPNLLNHINTAQVEWKFFRDVLESSTTRVKQMHEIAAKFQFRREYIFQFLRVVSITSSSDWDVKSKRYMENFPWIQEQMHKFDSFLFFSSLRLNLDYILNIKAFGEFVDGFLSDSGRVERQALWSTLSVLHSKFTDEMRCDELFRIQIPHVYANVLTRLQPRCIRTIGIGKDLLEWIRVSPTLQSDSEFQIQLERIRGKDVSSLPDEIPDQQALTVAVGELAVIRECFLSITNISKPHDHLVEFLEVLLQFNLGVLVNYDNISNCVVNSVKIKAALVELFEADDDVIIPNKLLYLSRPERNTRWRISSSSVCLTTFTVRHQSSVLSLDNLIDFQSKLNLSQSRSVKDSQMDDWIEAFNLQFQWCRKLQAVLHQLNLTGHPMFVNKLAPETIEFFDIPYENPSTDASSLFNRLAALGSPKPISGSSRMGSKVIDELDDSAVELFPLSVEICLDASIETANEFSDRNVQFSMVSPLSFHIIRQRVQDLEAELLRWSTRIRELMADHYFFNFFSISQIWIMINCLQYIAEHSLDVNPMHRREVHRRSEILAALFDLYGYTKIDVSYTNQVWKTLQYQGSVNSDANEKEDSSEFHLIEQFAVWIDNVMTSAKLRGRVFSNDAAKRAVDYEHIEPGLNIVFVSNEAELSNSILTLYFLNGCLPERENILFVEDSQFGQQAVNMLINRWGGAQSRNRGNNIFVIANFEKIPSDIQRHICLRLQEQISNASGEKCVLARLVVMIGGVNRAVQPICECFPGAIRLLYRALSIEYLANFIQDISHQYCHDITIFMSDYPGQGKSFQIRKYAQIQDSSILHLPVHGGTSTEEIISRVKNIAKITPKTSKIVLHMEVGSLNRTNESLICIIMELLVLGSLLNYRTGHFLSLSTKTYEFLLCIELSNWHAQGKISIASVLPCHYCILDETTFCSSGIELVGSVNSTAESYEQIQLVCKCLLLLDKNRRESIFPKEFLVTAYEMADISGQKAYELLSKYFNITGNCSGHRIWSLIRIFHHQVISMFSEGSYIAEVQEFMEQFFVYRTLQFLVLTAIDVCQPASVTDREGELVVKPWQDSNHEFMCLQPLNSTGDGGGGLTFLSLHSGASLLDFMPDFKQVLESYHMLDTTSYRENFVTALNSIIGSTWTQREANNLLGGNNCITVDSVMKMIAIFIRLQNKVPVVLMGECGCGKTQLIRYTCAYWRMDLLSLDCHGGTTLEDIVNVFCEAEMRLYNQHLEGDSFGRKVCVFLDEINTTIHIGLIAEIIINHSLHGVPLTPDIIVVGALNPYRLKQAGPSLSGLSYEAASRGARSSNSQRNIASSGINSHEFVVDPRKSDLDVMVSLVYKVHPVPDTLLAYILDFGALEEKTERLYVSAMISHYLQAVGLTSVEVRVFSGLILVAHKFVRDVERDSSVVSLRDVKRCLQLVEWFRSVDHLCDSSKLYANIRGKDGNLIQWTGRISLRSYVLALAVVYYYRLQSRQNRLEFWGEISNRAVQLGWELASVKLLMGIVSFEEELYCSQITFTEGIAKNEAVKENVFVGVTCIVNKIPLILVGKPGSSKTLTMQVIASNLNGPNSTKPFWKNFPSVSTFSYQCSPLSTAAGIQAQYERACSYQETQIQQNQMYASGSRRMKFQSVTILLLDEIGLAEHSPDQPLKVLHKILPEERISIVGISNWVLDPAKMNRAILLSRPDPSPADLEFTGQVISNVVTSSNDSEGKALGAKLLSTLAAAFHEVYITQDGRPFFGMRDYYSLLKHIRKKSSSKALDWANVLEGLCRNFGGKAEFLSNVIQCFLQKWQAQLASWYSALSGRKTTLISTPLSTLSMITDNLGDTDVRHLMIITTNGGALSVLQGCRLLPSDSVYLIGSQFMEDQNEHCMIVSVNTVKECMARGKTLVLVDQDSIYEALYDVLNLRTVKKTLRNGKTESMLRLAIGPSSQLCPVDNKFKLVVIVDQDEAYNQLDVPLLSRFEKQTLTALSAIPKDSVMSTMVRDLHEWLNSIQSSTKLKFEEIIPGISSTTIESYVLALTVYDRTFAEVHFAKPSYFSLLLKNCLTPAAVWSDPLSKKFAQDYFQVHGSLASIILHRLSETTDIAAAMSRFSVVEEAATAVLTLYGNKTLTSSEITLTSVRTWSSSATLNNSMAAICGEIAEKVGHQDVLFFHDPINVGFIKSEREFREKLRSLLFNTTIFQPSLIIVYCDATVLSHKLLRHVKFICEDLRMVRTRWSVNDLSREVLKSFVDILPNQEYSNLVCVPVISTHIVLVVCDHPQRNQIQFPLEFNPHWREYFCDDVRTENSMATVHKTVDLLGKSPFELAIQDLTYLERILASNFRLAFSCIRYVPGSQLISSTIRLQVLTSLMKDLRFMKLCTSGVLIVLEELNQGKIRHVHDHRDRSKKIIHSMREHLTIGFEGEIVFAFALFLVIVDRNYNCHLLESSTADMTKIWYDVATSHDGSWTDWAASFIRSSVSFASTHEDNTIDAQNDGTIGHMKGNFPFSFALIRFLNHPSTRLSVYSHVYGAAMDLFSTTTPIPQSSDATKHEQYEGEEDILNSMIRLSFGDAFENLLRGNENHMEMYFHDLLGMLPSSFPSVDMQSRTAVYRAYLRASHSRTFTSVGIMQAAIWKISQEVFNVLGALSVLVEYSSAYSNLVAFIIQLNHSEQIFNRISLTSEILKFVIAQLIPLWYSNPCRKCEALIRIRPYLDALYTACRGVHECQTQEFSTSLVCVFNHFQLVTTLMKELSNPSLPFTLSSLESCTFYVGLVQSLETADLRSRQCCLNVLESILDNFGDNRDERLTLFLQKLFQRIVFDIIIPSFDSHGLEFIAVAAADAEASENIRILRSNFRDLVELLLQVICCDTDGPHRILGVPFPFLRRSLLNFILSSANIRSILEARIKDALSGCEECSYCLSNIRSPVITNCGHIYCRECISEVLQQMSTCPLCRAHDCHVVGPSDKYSTVQFIEVIALYFDWYCDVYSATMINSLSSNATDTDPGINEREILLLPVIEAVKCFGLQSCCQVWFKIKSDVGKYIGNVAVSFQEMSGPLVTSRTLNAPHYFNSHAFGYLDKSGSVKSFFVDHSRWPTIYGLRSLLRLCGESNLYAALLQISVKESDLGFGWIPLEKLRVLLAPKEEDKFALFGTYSELKSKIIPLVSNPTIYDALLEHTSSLSFANRTALLFLFVIRASLQLLHSAKFLNLNEERIKDTMGLLRNWVKPPQTGITGLVMGESSVIESYWKIERHSRVQSFETAQAITPPSSVGFEGKEKLIAIAMGLFLGISITPNNVSIPALRLSSTSSVGEIMKLELAAAVVSRAIEYSGGWLFVLFSDPAALSQALLPSMPDDDIRLILKGLDRSSAGARKAYRCQCGNLYFIGDCGKAWVTSTCPNCGRQLGGHQHTLVESSTAVDDTELMDSKSLNGYVASGVMGATSVEVGRPANCITLRVLRIIIHSCLMLAAMVAVSDGRKTCNRLGISLCQFLNTHSSKQFDLNGACLWVRERLAEDWSELGRLMSANEDIVSRLLHFAVSRASSLFATAANELSTLVNREFIENDFENSVVNSIFISGKLHVVSDNISRQITEIQAQSGANQLSDLVSLDSSLKLLSAELLEEETVELVNIEHAQNSLLWRYRVGASFDDFVKKINIHPVRKGSLSLLRAVLANEVNLSTIAYLPAILKWHRILFEAFPDGTLSRRDAQSIRNIDVLQRLPPHQHDEGRRILENFIHGFNAAFPLLEHIFECEINPYRNSLHMSEETVIAFSLPTKPSTAGIQASEGICTVALAEMMVSCHNLLLDAVEQCDIGYSFDKNVPGTSQFSSMTVLEFQLCSYSRNHDLIPLLFNHAIQGSGLREGLEIDYDLDSIAVALAERLIEGKQRVLLNLRLYQYLGELSKGGFLAQLALVIPQQRISPAVEQSLREEVDGIGLVQLMRILETTIRLLSSLTANYGGMHQIDSGSTISNNELSASTITGERMTSQTPLHMFVIEALHIEATVWQSCSVPILRTGLILLCHLADIHRVIRESQGNDVFSSVDERYKTPLTSEFRNLLQVAVQQGLDKKAMGAALRIVLLENLADNTALNVSLSLKSDLLNFIDEVVSIPNFQELFPSVICIGHCMAVHEFFLNA